MQSKPDVNGAGAERARRWIPADVAMRITGHKTSETLRKAAKKYGQFDFRKEPTGQILYDLSGCLAYAGAAEDDFSDLLAGHRQAVQV